MSSLLALGLIAAACGSDGGGEEVAENAAPSESFPDASTEVFLEPVASLGTDPFFADLDALVPEPVTDVVQISLPAPEPETTLVEANLVIGTNPGLYGGTQDNAACNREQLVAFLEANPDKAEAWAAVQEIDPSEIRSFIDGLTPAVLLHDTRVTNHGFSNGVANPIQSVLQAGTAVLLDDTGVPRAKCACGNPLRKPIPQQVAVYVGEEWSDFDETQILAVDEGEPTESFELTNVDTGETFNRDTGTTGETDASLAPAAVDEPEITTTTTNPNYLTPEIDVSGSGPGFGVTAYIDLSSGDDINGVLLEGATSVSLSFNSGGGPVSGSISGSASGLDFDEAPYSFSFEGAISGTYDPEGGFFSGSISWSTSASSDVLGPALPVSTAWEGGLLPCDGGGGICAFGSTNASIDTDEIFVGWSDVVIPGVEEARPIE